MFADCFLRGNGVVVQVKNHTVKVPEGRPCLRSRVNGEGILGCLVAQLAPDDVVFAGAAIEEYLWADLAEDMGMESNSYPLEGGLLELVT